MKKTTPLLIAALTSLFFIGDTRKLGAFPIEREGRENHFKSSVAATEEKRRETEEEESFLFSGEGERSELDQEKEIQENEKTLEQATLTLDVINAALQKAPEAARFILKKDNDKNFLLVPEEADPARPGAVRSENIETVAVFKNAIQSAYPNVELEDLFAITPMAALREAPVLSAEKIKTVLARIEVGETIGQIDDQPFSLQQTEAEKAAAEKIAEKTKEKKILKKEFEEQSFETLPDRAVFWTGYLDGKGNQGRAEQYAKDTKKQTIEKTPGGIWLDAKKLYRPESVYASSDADLLWLNASRKFAKGASGHVVAFILETKDPNSIYHGIEKYILKNNKEVFLSQNILNQTAKELLNEEQQKQLHEEPIVQATLKWLEQAKETWKKISTIETFRDINNRTAFFEDLKNQLTTIKPAESEIASLKNKPIFSEVIPKVESLLATWNSLTSVLQELHKNNVLEAQAIHQNDLFERRFKSEGIETVPAWEDHYNWLREATQSAGYYIFKAYKDGGEEENAQKWKERYRAFEEKRLESLLEDEETMLEKAPSLRELSHEKFQQRQQEEQELSQKRLEELHQQLLHREAKARRLADAAMKATHQNEKTIFTQPNIYWDDAIAEAEEIISTLKKIRQEEEKNKPTLSSSLHGVNNTSWEESLQKTKTHQQEWEKKLNLWKKEKEEFFKLKAAQKNRRATDAWDQAISLVQTDAHFFPSWEKAVELAKEAYYTWRDLSNLPQESNDSASFLATMAEEQKNLWLERLKAAKVEPPLQLESEEATKAKISAALEAHPPILLPEPTETDQRRLELRKKLDELLGEDQNNNLPPEMRSRCSSSNASDFMLIQESIDLDKEILSLQEQWEQEVKKAEERRGEQVKKEGNKEENCYTKIFDLWRHHDQRILKAQRENKARLEKEERDRRLAANWEKETRRLRTRARADELWEEFNLKIDSYLKHKKQSNIENPDWEKNLQKLIQEIEQLQEKLEEARQDWEGMAERHPKVIEALSQGENATEEAKKQLKKSDRVIVDLKRNFEDQIYQGVANIRTRTMPPLLEEVERCKATLVEQKKELLKSLTDGIISIKEYAQLVEREALKDAKDNITGNKEAWEQLVKESQDAALELTGSYDNEAIAKADQAGYEILLREIQHLEDIQKRWLDQLDELSEQRTAAAQAYFNNNPLPWIMLTPQERYYYNAPIFKARELKADKELEEAQERARVAEEEEKRIKQSFLASEAEKARIQKEDEEAYQNLVACLKKKIEEGERSVKAAYEEVERIHAPESQGWFFGPSLKQKEQSIDKLVKHVSLSLDLQAELSKNERNYEYKKELVPLYKQAAKERALAEAEELEREEYLKWMRLTPQEKQSQIEQINEKNPKISLKNAIAAERLGKIKVAILWKKSSSKQIDFFAKEAEAKAKRSNEEGYCWSKAGFAAYWAIDYLEKSMEAQNNNKPEEAKAWRKVSDYQQQLLERFIKAAEAWTVGKQDAYSWTHAAYGAGSAAEYLKKSMEAQNNNKPEEAEAWRKVSDYWQRYCENKTKAAEAWIAGNKAQEAYSWDEVADGIGWAGRQLGFSIRAKEEEKSEESRMWEKVSATSKAASDQWSKAAKAHEGGFIEEANRHEQEGFTVAREAYQLIVSYCLEQEDNAKAASKAQEAATWHEVVKTSQLAITAVDHLRQLSPNQQMYCFCGAVQSWRVLIFYSYLSSHAFMRSISNTGEEATIWKTMARGYKDACDLKWKAAEAYEAGDETKGKRYNKEGEAAFKKVMDWKKY